MTVISILTKHSERMKTTARLLFLLTLVFTSLKTTSFSQQSNLLTTDEITNTEVRDNYIKIKAFPNPVNAGSWIIVQTVDQDDAVDCDLLSQVKELHICNALGAKVTSVTPKPTSCNVRIATQDLRTGLYIIHGKTRQRQDIPPIKVHVR